MKKYIAIILSIILILAVTIPAAAISVVDVKSIKLDKSNITLEIGETYDLNVTLTPANTTQRLLTYITWNQKVATIDITGKITGVSPGTASIFVYTPNKNIFAKCNVTVSKPAPKPTLRVLMGTQLANTTYNDYILAKQLTELTGYKVQYDALPADNATDKLNLIIASGEPYDLVSNSWTILSSFYRFAQQGALAPLDDVLDKYGPNIRAKISKETFNRFKVNNKIYGLGTPKGYGTADQIYVYGGLSVRQDWLDQLGIASPTTLDDFTKMLQAFKDKDPGKNGANNIPLTLRPDEVSLPGGGNILPGISGAFGISNEWVEYKGKLINRVEHPGFKEYLAYLNDLYNKGLIDKDFGVNKAATTEAKFTSGKAGVMQFGWSTIPRILDAIQKNIPQARLKFLQPPVGKDGQRGYSVLKNELDRICFIPKSSKNITETIKYLNLLLDTDTFRNLCIGVEGKHYNVVNGEYIPIYPIFNDERGNANVYLMGVDEKNFAAYYAARLKKDPRLPVIYSEIHVNMKNMLVQDPLAPMPYLPITIDNKAVMSQDVNDYAIKIVMGVEKLAGFDAYVRRWRANGGSAATKEVNDWYAKNK